MELENTAEEDRAYREGWAWHDLGRTLDGCPYDSGTALRISWLAGWLKGDLAGMEKSRG